MHCNHMTNTIIDSLWSHGSTRRFSPALNSSKQIEQDSHTSLSLRYFLFGSWRTLHLERPLVRHLRIAVLHCDVEEKGDGGREGRVPRVYSLVLFSVLVRTLVASVSLLFYTLITSISITLRVTLAPMLSMCNKARTSLATHMIVLVQVSMLEPPKGSLAKLVL